jgi:uncharacterized protein YndB with AHSA1/START domain
MWRALSWRRLLWTVAVLGGSFVALAAFLFSGSEVSCDETSGEESGSVETVGLSCAFEVAASPDAVWAALTTTNRPLPYYFDAVLEAELRPGGRWRFVTEARDRLLASGTVVAVEPGSRLVQTFRAADLDEPASRIVIDLQPSSSGTRVELVHDGFVGRATTFRRFRRAHPLALSALKALLETGELPLRARLYTAIFKPGMNFVTARAEPWETPSGGGS